jgi:glucans biosynthesis protein C
MKTQSNRQSYIDWLRAGAMFLLVIYHSGRLFDYDGWHIKNAELNIAIEVFNRFLDIWHMPLFFLLAGMSVWFALERRNLKEFSLERVLRLFVPLAFGMLLIVPPQVYVERLFRGQFSGSFIEWWPHTFSGPYPEGNLSWHHLWFLAYLFTFSLMLIPLFHYFRSEGGRRIVSKAAGLMAKPGAFLLPVIPLLIVNLTLRPIYGYGMQNLIDDWANFLYYSTIVLYGYILVSSEDVLQAVVQKKKLALGIAVPMTLLAMVIASGVIDAPQLEWLGELLELSLRPTLCWCYLVAIVGYGREHLNFSNRVLDYASMANMPVYVLHQTVIVLLGFFIIQLALPVGLKYALVIAATFVISIAGYELIKRTPVTRFLFGMRVRQSKKAARELKTDAALPQSR